MAGVAFAANAIVVYGDDVFAGNPLTAEFASEGVLDICAFAVGTGVQPFIRRIMKAVGFEQIDCFFEHFAAVSADHHASSPSLTRMYSPQ